MDVPPSIQDLQDDITVISRKEIKLEWTDIWTRKIRPRPPERRSPGWHLSAVLRVALEKQCKWSRDDADDEMPLRMAMGMAWEDWAVGLWKDLIWQPGEVHKDEIYGSPDGISTLRLCASCGYEETERMREHQLGCPCGGSIKVTRITEELKLTWKSEFTHPIEKEVRWLWQGGGYELMADERREAFQGGEWRWCRFHIGWVNGDYRPPSPKYMTYLVRFRKKALEEWWKRVMLPCRDKAVMEAGTKRGEEHGEGCECGLCD